MICNRKIPSLLFCFIALALSMLVASCNESKEKEKELDVFWGKEIHLKKGETFTIKMGQNGSIGMSNCWINETKCHQVELRKQRYESSQREKDGCEGCGGHVYWKFKGMDVGVDTIKIKSCPTLREQKSCSEFQEDSSCYQAILEHTSPVDRTIIVRVTK